MIGLSDLCSSNPIGLRITCTLILKLHRPQKKFLAPGYSKSYFPLPTCLGEEEWGEEEGMRGEGWVSFEATSTVT